MNKPTFN